MKKVILFAVVIGGLVFTSCTKKNNYTCTCSVPGSGVSSASQLTNITEDDATEACDNGTTVAQAVCTLSEN